MLITNPLPLTGANLEFCERTRDRINQDPDRRVEVITFVGECWVRDHSSPIYEEALHRGKKILGWDPDRGSGEA